MKRFLAAFFACALLLSGAFSARAEKDPEQELAALWQGILEENGCPTFEEWIKLPSPGDWLVIAAEKYASFDKGDLGQRLYAEIKDKKVSSSSRQKYALSLIAAGCGDCPYIDEALSEVTPKSGVMSLIFGLHVMKNGYDNGFGIDGIKEALIKKKLPSGGWAVSGENWDTDVTAMALAALAGLSGTREICAETVDLIMTRKTASGGFSGFEGENCETLSQVIIGFSACGEDILNDSRYSGIYEELLSYETDGGFCHKKGEKASPVAGWQGIMALQSLITPDIYRFERGSEPWQTAARVGWRVFAVIAAALAAAVWCLFIILRKQKKRNLLAPIALCLLFCGFIIFADIEAPGSFYSPSSGENTAFLSVSGEGLEGVDAAFGFSDGETVFDLLIRAAGEKNLVVTFEGSSETAYVTGIAGLYEGDIGPLSGWIYKVNGLSPAVGCGRYRLSPGDRVEWIFSPDLGKGEAS